MPDPKLMYNALHISTRITSIQLFNEEKKKKIHQTQNCSTFLKREENRVSVCHIAKTTNLIIQNCIKIEFPLYFSINFNNVDYYSKLSFDKLNEFHTGTMCPVNTAQHCSD